MKDLIEALQIFLKYENHNYPTHCEHDVLYVDISPDKISENDKKKLKKLGFIPGKDGDFISFRFGGA